MFFFSYALLFTIKFQLNFYCRLECGTVGAEFVIAYEGKVLQAMFENGNGLWRGNIGNEERSVDASSEGAEVKLMYRAKLMNRKRINELTSDVDILGVVRRRQPLTPLIGLKQKVESFN